MNGRHLLAVPVMALLLMPVALRAVASDGARFSYENLSITVTP